jgi:hypothetical protein
MDQALPSQSPQPILELLMLPPSSAVLAPQLVESIALKRLRTTLLMATKLLQMKLASLLVPLLMPSKLMQLSNAQAHSEIEFTPSTSAVSTLLFAELQTLSLS